MRAVLVAGVMVVAATAGAQDGAHVATLAKVKGHQLAWAGEFVRVENVTISHFSRSKGGLASDETGSARFDDVGMSLDTIGQLERYCSGPPAGQGRPECRGALEFTMRDGERGGFVISEANFIPED
jgi:hypothetical protein